MSPGRVADAIKGALGDPAIKQPELRTAIAKLAPKKAAKAAKS